MHTAIHRFCGKHSRGAPAHRPQSLNRRGFPGCIPILLVRQPMTRSVGAVRIICFDPLFMNKPNHVAVRNPDGDSVPDRVVSADARNPRSAVAASPATQSNAAPAASNFLRAIIADDNAKATYGGRVVTRFPPEPNGYLHYGHAKSIVLNFGLAADYGGACHLRFDDTNPEKEEQEYVDSIISAVKWLGADWGSQLYFASDYFDFMYDAAEK